MNSANFNSSIWGPVDIETNSKDNCGVLENGQIVERSCNSKARILCDLGQSPPIQIRGLCPETMLDTDFNWSNQRKLGRNIIDGYSNTLLQWLSENKNWNMWSTDDENITATIVDDEDNAYPFGFRVWNFQNDVCQNGEMQEDGSYTRLISIDSCGRNGFNCMDGTWYEYEIQNYSSLKKFDFQFQH